MKKKCLLYWRNTKHNYFKNKNAYYIDETKKTIGWQGQLFSSYQFFLTRMILLYQFSLAWIILNLLVPIHVVRDIVWWGFSFENKFVHCVRRQGDRCLIDRLDSTTNEERADRQLIADSQWSEIAGWRRASPLACCVGSRRSPGSLIGDRWCWGIGVSVFSRDMQRFVPFFLLLLIEYETSRVREKSMFSVSVHGRVRQRQWNWRGWAWCTSRGTRQAHPDALHEAYPDAYAIIDGMCS